MYRFHYRTGSKPDVGGAWLLLQRKKAPRRSSEGLNCWKNVLKSRFVDVRCFGSKTCACFVSGGVRAAGKDARHGGDPAAAAAWRWSLHCCSHRLHCSRPRKHSWRYYMLYGSFFALGLFNVDGSPPLCGTMCCPRSPVQWMATSSGCCVAWRP